MTSPAPIAGRPRFTIVSAVYNVSQFLPEFIGSVDRQTFPTDRVQIIVVDDGSTDDSLDLLRAWEARRPESVTVLTKANGGQGSARNLGLEHARGEWVTFIDPDDMIAENYLAEVDTFLRRHPSTVLVGTNRIVLDHAMAQSRPHPLRRHFTRQNRLRNLDHDNGHWYGSAPCAFFRLDRLNELNLRFDERIRPNFEDGHLCCLYLLRAPEPIVGFLTTAEYLYRKRGDGSSTLDRSWLERGRFDAVLEYGFLPLLREAQERTGSVPGWLQSIVLYELSWYFKAQDAILGAETVCHGEVADRFNELLTELVGYLDPATIRSFIPSRLKPVWRDALIHGYNGDTWHAGFAVVDKIDPKQQLLRVSYRFTGDQPDEVLIVDGAPTQPVYSKIRDFDYFDRTRLHERIAWLPIGTLRVVLDGENVDVRTAEPDEPTVHLDSLRIRRKHQDRVPDSATRRVATELPLGRRLVNQAVVRLAHSAPIRKRFDKAWVLIDRVHNADDSAEHLFRFLRAKRRKINAWFVIEAGTPDHARLRKDGYLRVVPHGSLRWKLLMLNCEFLISSHADKEVVSPPAIRELIAPTWRTVFLQHGVIKDDLSRWLNFKDFDLFVTSTPGEHESIVGNGTPYRYTDREARLTGLPRFDRILAEGKKFPPDRRDLILVAPTWRGWLMDPHPTGEHRRHADLGKFHASEYAQQWLGFLRSPELMALAEKHGLTVALLMHPNLQSVADRLGTPEHVELLRYEGNNAQELFARARVVLTDYSSIAFNAAYIERPLVYFQFDRERFFSGAHAGRPGYFEYERDGFGPVAYTIDEALAETGAALGYGPSPQPEFLRRIQQTFPERDGRCCDRVAKAIASSSRRVPRAARFDDPVLQDGIIVDGVDGAGQVIRLSEDDPSQQGASPEDEARDGFGDARVDTDGSEISAELASQQEGLADRA